jgi:hypothetical protein
MDETFATVPRMHIETYAYRKKNKCDLISLVCIYDSFLNVTYKT